MYDKGVYTLPSVKRLGLDLNQDPLELLNKLLSHCLHDFSHIFTTLNQLECDLTNTHDNSASELVQLYTTLFDRISALAALSPSVFSHLRKNASIRHPTLVAVYRVLSLAMWSTQRSIRCAGLRSLRHYIRTSDDVDAFLANRLDLLVTRCLDLSFTEELLAPLLIANGGDPDTLEDHIGRRQRQFVVGGPYRRHLESGKSAFQRPFRKGTAAPSGATSITERLSVLRLAFHLLRLSPGVFSPDLLHAVASAATATPSSGPPVPAMARDRGVLFDDGGALNPQTAALPTLDAQFDASRERDTCLRAYLLLLTEFVVRSCETPASKTRAPPLEVAVKTLLSALPCCSEPGEVYKHPSPLLEAILLALVNLSSENAQGRLIADSWVFQKCVAPFLLTYPHVSVPRSPYDSNPSFIAATRDSLVFVLRSWSGLFYFLREGQSCLHTLTQSLQLGSSRTRALVLDVLYNLFPGLSAPAPFTPVNDTAHAVMGQLSSALYSGLPYPLCVYTQRRSNSSCSRPSSGSLPDCLPPFPHLDGDFVVEEGLRIFPSTPSTGTDLLEAHSALLLGALTQAGLFEALVTAVEDRSLYVAAAAGQLLGVLAFRATSHLHPRSLCAERLSAMPLLLDRFRAVDFIDRIHQLLVERIHAGARPRLSAPFISPFLESLCRQDPSQQQEPLNSSPVLQSSSAVRSSGSYFSPLKKFTQVITKSASATQYVNSLLDNVVAASGVCNTSSKGRGFPASSSAANIDTLTSGSSRMQLSSPYDWNWEALVSWARKLSQPQTSTEPPLLLVWKEPNTQLFLTRLMDFFTPNLEVLSLPLESAYSAGRGGGATPSLYPALFKISSGDGVDGDCFPLSPVFLRLVGRQPQQTQAVYPDLAWTSRKWGHSWAVAVVLGSLLPHLSIYPADSFPGSQLRRFLSAVRTCLVSATSDDPKSQLHCTHLPFEHSHLRENCSSLLLFSLGRLLSTDSGASLLHSLNIPDLLTSLAVGDYSRRKQQLLSQKLLLSSLNYPASGGFGWSLLATVCSRGHTAQRRFAARFMRLLVRLEVPSVGTWVAPLLIGLATEDRSPRVVKEALEVLQEACLNSGCLQALVDYIQGEEKQPVGEKRCCLAFPTTVLRLLSIGSLESHRVVACLLAKSSWLLKTVSTPKLVGTFRRGPQNAHPRGGIEGSLLETLLNAWMETYNLEYARRLERSLLDSFRLPVSSSDSQSSTSSSAMFFSRCPACSQPLFDTKESKETPKNEDGDDEDDAIFLNRHSNRLFFSHLDDVVGENSSLCDCDVVIELSQVAVGMFERNRGSLPVPLHLFYCLALQPAGYSILRDKGYLTTLADVVSSGCVEGCQKETVMRVKAAIWALVGVLVTPNGSQWQRASSVLKDVFWLVGNAESLSLRGSAWLSLCFLSSSAAGATLLQPWVSLGSITGEEDWLLSTTDRETRLWSLQERPTLCLNAMREATETPSSPSPLQRHSYQEPTDQRLSVYTVGNGFDGGHAPSSSSPSLSPRSAVSEETHSLTSFAASSSKPPINGGALDHPLLRPVRWIARRTTRGGGGRGGKEKQPPPAPTSVSIKSATGAPQTTGLVQSLSSPGCFTQDSVVGDGKSASALSNGSSLGGGVLSSLTETLVYRGLLLPRDVRVLGTNFFPRSSEPQLNGINGDILADRHRSESDTCLSEACRAGKCDCFKPGADSSDGGGLWRECVLENVDILMNSLLLGRVCCCLLDLSSEAQECPRIATACLHAKVARKLSNYRYSRSARALVQIFLGQFPPSNELLADAQSALDRWRKSASLKAPPEPLSSSLANGT